MNKEFYKQPSFIASCVVIVCYLLFPYFRVSIGGFGSASATEICKTKCT